METKQLKEMKVDDKGEVEAVIATLNVIDKDKDVTLPGAFRDGQEVRISAYNHASWGNALPVGKGQIQVVGEEALLRGQFFMETTGGKDTFNTVKGLGGLGQWSYGFDVTDSSTGQHEGEDVRFLKGLDVIEASPVLLGAGEGTRTVGTKSADVPLSEEADSALRAVESVVQRVLAFGSQSTDEDRKNGRGLSTSNRERLERLTKALREAGVSLDEFLAETDPNQANVIMALNQVRLAEIARTHTLTVGGETA